MQNRQAHCATAVPSVSAIGRYDLAFNGPVPRVRSGNRPRLSQEEHTNVVLVNDVWDEDLTTPDAVLARYTTLTGWAEAIHDAGAAVAVAQRFKTDAHIERAGVTYRFLGHPLHHAIVGLNPDLVHLNGVLQPLLVRRVRALVPSHPIVVQDHGGVDPTGLSILRRAWIRRGLSEADALLVAAEDQESIWRASGVVPVRVPIFDVMEGSTSFVPMPRDAARRLSGVDGSPAVLWVGRLDANKDPVTIVRGFALFAERHPGASLTMVYGTSDLEADVRRTIAESPLDPTRIRLVGRVPHDDLAAYYNAADFFVLGSRREGSGYAVVEALACGTIPVLTDIPSFRTLTDRGNIGGALWNPGDSTSFASSLERAWSGYQAGSRAAARALFERRFSWPAIGQRAIQIYHQVRSHRANG